MSAAIRPVQSTDIQALVEFAKLSGVGVTSLPDNREKMAAKLARAVSSFNGQLPKEQALYLFALEVDKQLVGICAIEARIGFNEVWYNYRLSTQVHCSNRLNTYQKLTTLNLCNDLTGCSELCTLFLLPNFRKGSFGSLLSKCRYLFLRSHSDLFSDRIIAEMRGFSDKKGQSPFWNGLGSHFFDMSFSDADYLTGLGNKEFIAQLMPKYPIYTAMLDPNAEKIIAQVHPQTQPALAMLEAEGFEKNGYVDIFDAGPAVEAKLKNIRAVKKAKDVNWQQCDHTIELDDDKHHWLLVANHKLMDYRAIIVHQDQLIKSTVHLTAQQINDLKISKTDLVQVVTVKDKEHS